MKRDLHGLSHYKLFSCDMAELIPVACVETLPGDTIEMSTSMLIRVSPLNTPVMHPVSVRVHHWFVPNRLVWSDWEKFITGGSDGLGGGAVYPTITFNNAAQGSLADYFGIPPLVASNRSVSALPFRAYNKIFNENYRDEDLVTERATSTAGGADATTVTTVAKCAWQKDRFTQARPWTQKGPTVTVPLGTSAAVKGVGISSTAGAAGAVNIKETDATGARATTGWSSASTNFIIDQDAGNVGFPNIYADLSTAAGPDVIAFRRALALQRYEEARAMYGDRYPEYLAYLGVRSSDARLQRPEYLGGGKQTISFSEVLQTGVTTSGTPSVGVGSLLGHGIAAARSRKFVKFFEEHGHIISLLSVRPRTMYADGIDKMWLRTTKEDYWQRELQDIGQEAVLNKEVYSNHGTPDGTFGYGDRYYSYKSMMSQIAGEMRSTLNMWHYARIFGAPPALNSSFVECDPTKRVNQVTSNDVLWVMAQNHIRARRLVKRSTVGRVI